MRQALWSGALGGSEAATLRTAGRLAYDAFEYCLREMRSTAHAVDEGFASTTGVRRILRNATEVGMIAAIALAKRPARAAAAVALATAIPRAYLAWRGLKAGALLASERRNSPVETLGPRGPGGWSGYAGARDAHP